MATLHLPVDRSAHTPLHRQVYDGLRRAVLDGRLRPGQRLPSTRALAVELDISRLPVLAAYDQLRHEGYLDGRIGSGTFVSASLPDDLLSSSKASAGPPHDGTPPVQLRYGGLAPFRTSLPALDAFPHSVWSRLVARHAHALTPEQMAYGDPAGVVPLRIAIAEHLRTSRGVRCEASQILVVPGSQAALRLTASVLLSTGDRAAMEEPGYFGARSALGANGAEVLPVPLDDEGLRVTALNKQGYRVRAVYVTPSHQYPLGTMMTAARRLALLDWAVRTDAWVVEDEYDSEYRYVSRPLGALQGMTAHGRVIYIGTFSKVMFPSLRVGYIVVPPSLWKRFMSVRETFDLFSPTLYQLALADFIRDGHFARHVRRMRRVYQSRRDALLAGLARHYTPHLTVHNADAGLHVAAMLAPGLDDRAVVLRMRDRGLTATALSSSYAGRAKRSGLLLGFGGSTERRLTDATRLLGEVLRTAVDRGRQ
jgi:GntR family transcriptional regulator/MocR family aminotransferase